MIKAAQGLLPSLAFTDSISVGSCLLPLLRCQDYSSSKGFRPIFTTINTTKMSTESYQFGPYKIDPKEVFYSTYLSYAMVNLRPLLPGLFSSTPLHTAPYSLFHFQLLSILSNIWEGGSYPFSVKSLNDLLGFICTEFSLSRNSPG
ncbi:hypothetical protein SADUNF_Sadunf19G0119500 [Salix dunnii]|uniref:Uncharacterized protein n=1 Tax=Salix dunnii TaxID=1413687 RepID=A0A835MFR7_9ROSI|nr:hypothetical protein SADUNF_Sadunf19G0119500 [Salix dunnii]